MNNSAISIEANTIKTANVESNEFLSKPLEQHLNGIDIRTHKGYDHVIINNLNALLPMLRMFKENINTLSITIDGGKTCNLIPQLFTETADGIAVNTDAVVQLLKKLP